MRFQILHEIQGRMRIHITQKSLTDEQADALQYVLSQHEEIISAKVYERTADVVVQYRGKRQDMVQMLQELALDNLSVPQSVTELSGRATNREYQDKLAEKIMLRMGSKLFLPYPVRCVIAAVKSVKYIWKGLQCALSRRIEVPLLDGIAIGVSILRGDMDTAGSVMFLLDIGEILETWTHKKSVDDLARSMSLNISKVWMLSDDQEVQVDPDSIVAGDMIVVHMGNMIPFDGIVVRGEGMVNQSSLTGESMPVEKKNGGYVYAGTVLEEGELVVQIKVTSGSTRYEKIITMIEETEKLKSGMESKAEHLADRLVLYTLLGTGAVYLLTANPTKALAVLMVDFSCALKLAMPISVISAMCECTAKGITVKGGKFLEAVAQADTIVFDKTGTLTHSSPRVARVVTFGGNDESEMLRLAACLEEHYPHSIANAVVEEARLRGLDHEERHSTVEYVVAHGISSTVDGKKAVIGSYHFIFEDECCVVPEQEQQRFDDLPSQYSHLYLAVGGVLAAVICIEDPLRDEAAQVIEDLHRLGFKNVVMMTGDSERTARSVAAAVGIDDFHYEVLPEDKASFIKGERQKGCKVIMIGDGVNDSPALSEADAGIAISTGAAIAKEIADITISAQDLFCLVTLRKVSEGMMKRIGSNYCRIIGFNAALMLLGASGIITPAMSALLHNSSTVAISLASMKNYLEDNAQ